MLKRILPVAVIGTLVVSSIFVGGCIAKRIICKTPEKRAESIVKKLTKKLDLTKEQVDKVNQIKDEILERTKKYKDEREAMHNELLDLMKSDKLDRAKLESFVNKYEARMKELKPFFLDKIIEFHNILTPEQRNKIIEKVNKFYHYCD